MVSIDQPGKKTGILFPNDNQSYKLLKINNLQTFKTMSQTNFKKPWALLNHFNKG